MKLISAERFVEKLEVDVFPIALIKFMLNKRKIMWYFSRAANDSLESYTAYTSDYDNCEDCKSKKDILCRKHTSIDRVLNADRVAFDLDTNVYIYKNEIFRMVGEKLVIIYCPHPKLIKGDITDIKVRKVTPITVEDPKIQDLPKYNKVRRFLSTDLMDQHMKCWFNREFSIVTIPKDRDASDWCLVANR
jgi:hypothetical protein